MSHERSSGREAAMTEMDDGSGLRTAMTYTGWSDPARAPHAFAIWESLLQTRVEARL